MYKREHSPSTSGYSRSAVVPPPSRALLLCDEKLSLDERNLTNLLDFFGIPWKAVSPGEMTRESTSAASDSTDRFCILSSAPRLAEALQSIAVSDAALPAWMLHASSVYIYGFQETSVCRKLLRFLTSATEGDIRKPAASDAHVFVTSDFPEMCGPMSGLQVPVKLTEKDLFFDVRQQAEGCQNIISANRGEVFVSVIRSGVRFFLNACSGTIDVNCPATTYFDVKEHFCRAVPIAMYLRWAFADICWIGTETRGCLIVDDPLLKPRYGFLRFSDTLELMDSHNFTTTIAFIPWNWRRTDRQTVHQFKSHTDKLSLCVHGCDHSAGEFATRSTALLNRRIKTASQRMELLFQRTSLQHDNIMVFPQGMFSPEAGRALKLNGFVAAVNTEVAPSGSARNDTKIADLWNVAIMKYGTFPIFTRRYLTHGVENFAFDALLGKPCLMVAHHEVFKDRGRELMEFIGRLNSLKWNLRWCSLGRAISHSFKIRNCAGGTRAIQMYAEHLVIENPSAEPREALALKEESDPDCVKAVMINQKTIDHTYAGNHLQFRVTMSPGERTEVRVTYFDKLELDPRKDGIAYSMKMQVRRHLSELRDNYVSQNDFLYATAARVKRFLN
ncbi:MAG TPA: hypothetical protein VOA64_07565 [Candidatus Dormibacteraeota bacterium]|nr:hypothetical protein [Candidatus Dormibacteraeota bacterium]